MPFVSDMKKACLFFCSATHMYIVCEKKKRLTCVFLLLLYLSDEQQLPTILLSMLEPSFVHLSVLRTRSCTLQHRHKWRLFSLWLCKPTGEPNSSPLPWQPGMRKDGTLYTRQSRGATLRTQLSFLKSVQRAAQKHWSLQNKVKLRAQKQMEYR